MSIIRISKEFTFEMAHALTRHKGKCAGLHGHSYHLTVTILGEITRDPTNPEQGMVMDFSDLKKITNEKVLEVFDHAVVLHEKDPICVTLGNSSSKLVKTPYQPTCENLLTDIAKRLQSSLPKYVKLHSLKLRETDTSYGEWFAEDNTRT